MRSALFHTHSLRVEILAAGSGRDLQSLRRYEPGQVQRISALPTGQRFLSPLSGISLERTSFNAAAQAGSRGCGPRRAKCCTTAEARTVHSDLHEDAREVALEKMKTMAFAKSRDGRKRVEMRFAHLKTRHSFEADAAQGAFRHA